MELSDDGVKKSSFARDAFALKLMEHIENSRPELTRYQQLDRFSKLLGVIKEVKHVSRFWNSSMTAAVVRNGCGLYGRITYDLYVNSKK